MKLENKTYAVHDNCNVHVYDVMKKDYGVGSQYTLRYSKNANMWTNSVHGKKIMRIRDTGNGIDIKTYREPFCESLDYDHVSELRILLSLISELDNSPFKIVETTVIGTTVCG